MVTAPNQFWRWDITKLLGPAKWTYCDLYVILDIYSRYVVGWMLAHRESQHLSERLIHETLVKEGIGRDHLTIHSDRGPAMRSEMVSQHSSCSRAPESLEQNYVMQRTRDEAKRCGSSIVARRGHATGRDQDGVDALPCEQFSEIVVIRKRCTRGCPADELTA